MPIAVPNRKDIAEFFRLSSLAGICKADSIQRWVDSVVAADPKPHTAFIELCTGNAMPSNVIQGLLSEVPGTSTANLSARMLLGQASRLISERVFTPEDLFLRLYRIASLGTFPEDIYNEFEGLDDGLCLAKDGTYGTVPEALRDITAFFNTFEAYAPDFL